MMYSGCLSCGQTPCRNAPDIPTVVTFLSFIISLTHEPIRAYSDTVSELDSSFVIYSYCGRPLVHPLPIIFPDRFLLKNMKYPNACFLISQVTLYVDNISMHPLSSRFFSSSFSAA